MTVQVRLGPADVDEVAHLEADVFGESAWSRQTVAEELTGPGRWYVGRRDTDGVLLAYAGAWWDGDVVQVMTLAVDRGHRRRGLGSALLTALIGHARSLAAPAVLLEVRVDNAEAIALYQREGFVVLGRRKRYYQPEDVDAWTMRLEL